MRGDRLKRFREIRGLSQAELGKRIGIHTQQLYKIEVGLSDNPSSDTLIAMARELGVSVDYLLGLVEEPNDHLKEAELSPTEHKLLEALRNGLITEALQSFTAISQSIDQAKIAAEKPTIDG